MKKLIIIVIAFAFSFSHAQISKERFVSNSINSFRDGEWLQFRVHYGFFNAKIEIELKKKIRWRICVSCQRLWKVNWLIEIFF